MGSMNVEEWNPEQVAHWISGLEPSVAQYVPILKERGLNGAKLLMLRCDDLEYLGMHVIGHQELFLEAVENLRNFHYEVDRECVQQLALRVLVAAGSLSGALTADAGPLTADAGPQGARLPTARLADVATLSKAVKPLACWLERWSTREPVGAATGSARWAPELVQARASLLLGALEAAACAQRERFAERPAAVCARAAARARLTATHILQEINDPWILEPASVASVSLRLPASTSAPASASASARLLAAALVPGDEILQVNGHCVIGWSASSTLSACRSARGELHLRLRRAPRPPPHPPHRSLKARASPVRAASPASSSGSSALSPPASPPAEPRLPQDVDPHNNRMYPPKPRSSGQRRHSVCCGTPQPVRRAHHHVPELWRELKQQSWTTGVENDDPGLYARDKAVSCSAGLERSPRPRTSPVPPTSSATASSPVSIPFSSSVLAASRNRGRLDKSHSTPAYDLETQDCCTPSTIAHQVIPESPTTPSDSPTILVHSAEHTDKILDFKKSSNQIEEAIQQRNRRTLIEEEPEFEEKEDGDRCEKSKIIETINLAATEKLIQKARGITLKSVPVADGQFKTFATSERVRAIQEEIVRSIHDKVPSKGKTQEIQQIPMLRTIRQPVDSREWSPLKTSRRIDASQISLPLKLITSHDLKIVSGNEHNSQIQRDHHNDSLQSPSESIRSADRKDSSLDSSPMTSTSISESCSSVPTMGSGHAAGVVRNMLTTKGKGLRKKSSLLAKGRNVRCESATRGGCAGAVWQRGRHTRDSHHAASHAAAWALRTLVVCEGSLYTYRLLRPQRAACRLLLHNCTAAPAPEVYSKPHAFKVYHTGTVLYFAADSREAMTTWISIIHRATLLPSPHVDFKQYSETEISDSESESESSEKREHRDKDKQPDKDKSKFNSLKKLTHRIQRSESQEQVAHAATSLDRKYLRFFSRRNKDDSKSKSKSSGVPVPTEHYRSYRRVPVEAPSLELLKDKPLFFEPLKLSEPLRDSKKVKIPKPINYIHASNPNLLDFEKSDFVTKPMIINKPKVHKPEQLLGFVTLEEFMLREQAAQKALATRGASGRPQPPTRPLNKDLQKRLERIVPDVIYGSVGPQSEQTTSTQPDVDTPPPVAPRPSLDPPVAPRPSLDPPVAPRPSLDPTVAPRPSLDKPMSVTGSDGYEKIVYGDESGESPSSPPPAARAAPQTPPRAWRDSLRRRHKVHSGACASPPVAPRLHVPPERSCPQSSEPKPVTAPLPRNDWGWTGARPQYPHLQCPPTFQPETYSLATLATPTTPHSSSSATLVPTEYKNI